MSSQENKKMPAEERKKRAETALMGLKEGLNEGAQALESVLSELQPRKKWGGVRLGAGRPSSGETPATKRVIFRLTPEEMSLLEPLCEDGESTNQVARRVLLNALKED